MDLGTSAPLLATWWATAWARLPWILLGSGVAVLWMTLLLLMLSRWGQARTLSKCIALSVLAHLLLLGYACLIVPLRPLVVGPTHRTVGVQLLVGPEADVDSPPESTWQPSTALPESDLQESLPQPDSWQPETTFAGLLPTASDMSSELAEVVGDLPATESDLRSAVDELADLPPADPMAATQLAVQAPPRQSRVEQELQLPLPTPAPVHAAPPADVVDDASPADRPPQDPVADALGMELLSNAEQLPELVAGEQDVAADDASRAATQTAAALAETAAGRVPSRTVSLATRRTLDVAGLPAMYRGRQPQQRQRLVIEQGGSADTEAAVDAALAWLARSQHPRDGHWDTQAWEGGRDTREFAASGGTAHGIQADTATTGLALLAFLAAGHTHQQGEYQPQVARGVDFLRSSQSPATGCMAGNAGRYVAMYCHGIATLALSEAYIMTHDESLRRPLERAVHYTVVTQHPTTGGWRYQPGDQGDTSQFGWQVMALVSARSAGIEVPAHVWQGADRWLQRVSLGSHGGLACYTPDQRVASHAMTAEALTCRFFLQTEPSPELIDEAANFIVRAAPDQDPLNLYYFYYATLAMHQVQDHRWVAWNRALTAKLLETQRSAGSLTGSWDPDPVWGYTGGRVYSTALACLCLETYYRYLPLLDQLGPTAGTWRERR